MMKIVLLLALFTTSAAILTLEESTAATLANLPYSVNRTDAVGPFGKCDTVKLNVCHQKFNNILGIASTVDWDSPAQFSYAINRVFYTGRDGYQKVCTARQVYQHCLGAAYFACTDPLFLMSQGKSKSIAFQYLTMLNSLEFDCVQGFQVGIKNFPCIASTSVHSADPLQQCVATYEKQLNSGTAYCVASQTLVNCYEAIFRRGCTSAGSPGAAAEAGWFICGEVRNAFFTGGCHIQCSISN